MPRLLTANGRPVEALGSYVAAGADELSFEEAVRAELAAIRAEQAAERKRRRITIAVGAASALFAAARLGIVALPFIKERRRRRRR